MTDLTALLSRLSEAKEGSRELDAAICEALGYQWSEADRCWTNDTALPRFITKARLEHYTTSIDAALTTPFLVVERPNPQVTK